MAGQKPNFWSRLVSKLRFKSARNRPGLPQVGEDGLLADPAEMYAEAEADAADKPARQLTRWTKRDQAIAQLQEDYERVSRLIEDIQNHMATQGERSERMCLTSEQLLRTLTDLPAITRQQGQALEAIIGQLETGNTRVQRLSESLNDLPKVLRTQADTLTGINRQLEMAGEQNVVASQNMDKISVAVNALGESTGRQTDVLKEMIAGNDEKSDRLNQLLARQNRRFFALFIVTIVLVAGALAATVISLARG